VSFGVFGGVLNAIELPVFTSVQRLSSAEVGFAIGAFGAGGLVVFAASTIFMYASRTLMSCLLLLAGVGTWLVASDWWIYAAFFIAGLGYSLFNAALRIRFERLFVHSEHGSTKDQWAWLFQLSLLTSLLVYCAATAYFAFSSGLIAPLVVLGVSAAAMMAAATVASVRKQGAPTSVLHRSSS
jgi:hypothetical protein